MSRRVYTLRPWCPHRVVGPPLAASVTQGNDFLHKIKVLIEFLFDTGAIVVGVGEEGLEDTEVVLYLNQVRP